MSKARIDMDEHSKDQLLIVLMYVATPEVRRRLMAEVPAAYNAWCGRDVVQVVHTDDLSQVSEA